MVRSSAVIFIVMLMFISCSRMEQRGARYNAAACPICSHITDGTCSFCKGTKTCMYCNGTGERRVVSPNYSDEEIKPLLTALAALQADPTLNDARYQLSRTYWCMERKEEAKALLEQYLDLGGGDYAPAARKALRENY